MHHIQCIMRIMRIMRIMPQSRAGAPDVDTSTLGRSRAGGVHGASG